MDGSLVLENDNWQVTLLPGFGGTVTHARVTRDGAWVDVLRPTVDESLMVSPDAASYPLAPFSNRIRDGRLNWAGKEHLLRPWPGQPNAMHGTAFEFAWDVTESSATHAELSFDSRKYVGVNWPWDFVARFRYELDGAGFVWTMRVDNVGDEPFPAGIGHHPYFLRQVELPDGGTSGDALLQLNCEQAYTLTALLATKEAEPLTPRLDFTTLRGLGDEFVDDCWTGRTGAQFARIEYPGAFAIDIDADEVLTHGVVYIPLGGDIFAVEPVSHANDAFNLLGEGVEGVGGTELAPGETLEGTFSLTVGDA